MTSEVLIVPGLRNSGPAHWQTLWQTRHAHARVEQADWSTPRLADWTAALDRHIRTAARKVVLVAHSFGCLAAIQRLGERSSDVGAALLVAPADPDKFGLAGELRLGRLPVPTILVASVNDPWLSYDRAAGMAERLGAVLVNAGAAGHINAESGYGEWPEGERLLARAAALAGQREREVRVPLALSV